MFQGGTNKITLLMMLVSVVLLAGMESCNKDGGDGLPPVHAKGTLEKLFEQPLEISEPSGLAFGPGDTTLLVVSDNTNKVYEINLNGEVLRTLDYTGNDLEGVAYNPYDNLVAVTEERKRQLVILDYTEGKERQRADIPTGGNTENKGLEGVSYNRNNRAYYLVNEDLPGELILWSPSAGIISTAQLNFAADYSGIFADAQNGFIYIVSDESRALFKCDYNAKVITEYPLPDTKFEGVAVDGNKNLVYLVNDKTGKYFIFKIKHP